MADYSSPNGAELAAMGALYGLRVRSAERIPRGLSNSSFLIEGAAAERAVLTILDNHDHASARRLVRTLDHVAVCGLPADPLMVTRSGAPLIDWRGRPCIMRTFIRGSLLADMADPPIGALGALLATIHRLPPPSHLEFGSRRIPRDWRTILAGQDCDDLKQAIEDVEPIGEGFANHGAPRAFIHGDLFLDNAFRAENGLLHAIDWEAASIDSPLLDIGIAAAGLLGAPQGMLSWIAELIDGYRETAPLDVADEQVIHAISYSAVLLAFYRFVRDNIHYPKLSRASNYGKMLIIAALVDESRARRTS